MLSHAPSSLLSCVCSSSLNSKVCLLVVHKRCHEDVVTHCTGTKPAEVDVRCIFIYFRGGGGEGG